MGLFRKKPHPVWFVLRPNKSSSATSHPQREGPYTRATIIQLYAEDKLADGALLWTNEKIFPNAENPNSLRQVRIMDWRRLDQLPDPVVRQLAAEANTWKEQQMHPPQPPHQPEPHQPAPHQPQTGHPPPDAPMPHAPYMPPTQGPPGTPPPPGYAAQPSAYPAAAPPAPDHQQGHAAPHPPPGYPGGHSDLNAHPQPGAYPQPAVAYAPPPPPGHPPSAPPPTY